MSSHGQDDGGVYRPPMIAPTAMEGEERSRDRRSKVRAEKEIQRRASRSAFIKELANEVEGRPEEVREVVGATESKAMQRDRARLEARAQEEEELFARVPLSRVDRKKVKQLKQARNGYNSDPDIETLSTNNACFRIILTYLNSYLPG
jgi:U3 small nucleolar ribonucleoprotein protein LCP5